MLKKAVQYFWPLRYQFIKYFIIGFSGVILDIGSLYLLKQYFHLRPVIAVVINQAVLLNYVFFLNKYWAFKARGFTRKQAFRFFWLASFNYIFSIGWMYFLNEKWGVNYIFARIANIALAVGWNFLLYRNWVYKPASEDAGNSNLP